jgi:hypothetical protein
MLIRRKLRKLLTGLSLPQEYICLDQQLFTQPFSVYLSFPKAKQFANVTGKHIFLGYKPLVIGLFFETGEDIAKTVGDQEILSLSFQLGDFIPDGEWRGIPASKSSVARLTINKIKSITLGNYTLLLYEGVYGEHHFINGFHQLMSNVRERFSRRKEGNVSLEKNLYDQVRIAYAMPRNISVISVGDGKGKVNMFPTDLHGPIGDEFYAGSLRLNGKANEQVERYRQIVISQVSASSYQQVYAMGKNHMQELRDENIFDLHIERSKTFELPVPSAMQQYRELRLLNSFDIGIHRVHMYETVYCSGRLPQSVLSHIHLYYGQWRQDHHLNTEMLFR